MIPPCPPGLWACSPSVSEPAFLAVIGIDGAVSELTDAGASFFDSEQPARMAALAAARAREAESITALRIMSILLGDQINGKSHFGGTLRAACRHVGL